MKGFTVVGEHGFAACELTGDAAGELGCYLDVAPATPALYASIADPSTGQPLDPAQGQLTVTDPSGTAYNADANTANHFTRTQSGHLQALCLLAPTPGRWRVSASSTTPAKLRAMLATVPAAEPLASALGALAPHFPGSTDGAAAQVGFDVLRWGLSPLVVVVSSARALPGLQLNLASLLTTAFGIDSQAAQRAVQRIAGQAASGTLLTIAREGQLIPPATVLQVLVNGAAEAGLSGWTVTESGGDGWAVQPAYNDVIGYQHQFAASYGWCRKQQTIDFVSQAGLTADFMDTAPTITITDWVVAPTPAGTHDASHYELSAQLLDADGAAIKEVTSGAVVLEPSSEQPQWRRIQYVFERYGPGVRKVLFAHGGLSAAQWSSAYGVKLTGAGVTVQLAPPGYPPAELVANGSGQAGLNDWTNTSPVGNPWTVQTGPGRLCPTSPGATAFAVSSGSASKQQTIDLVAAGFRPDFLDTSPSLQAGQWVAGAPQGPCTYRLAVTLLDAQEHQIAQLDSGQITVAAGPQRFQPLVQAISGYPAGLRSILFSHAAQPGTGAEAMIAGTTLIVLVPQPNIDSTAVRTLPIANPVPDPTVQPYYWVCLLKMKPQGGGHPYLGSGALVDQSGRRVVMTAAHNMINRWPLKWLTSIEMQPGSGPRAPYDWVTAGGGALQFPIEFVLHNQGEIAYDGLFDYGVVIASGANWPVSGFVMAAEDDAQIDRQAVTITAFPADPPFTPLRMYTEDCALTAYPADRTQAKISTSFVGGASGGPVYVRASRSVVGVFSHGSLAGYGSPYIRRIDDHALLNVARWSRGLVASDRVCSLQLVIHTGDDAWAGTDDPIELTFDGHRIPLDEFWMPMSGNPRYAKERGHFDGYELSCLLSELYPDGLRVRDLPGKRYQLRRTATTTWFDGDWQVESLLFFINGQRYALNVTQQWLSSQGPQWEAIEGRLP